MRKITEKGRSMIEMLGVLTIVGVLSLGGLRVVGQFQANLKSTQMVNDAADLARQARKMSRQYDSAYSSRYGYNIYLYKNNAYPKGFTFTGEKFKNAEGVIYWIDDGNGWFSMEIDNLSDEYCMKLATNDWGTSKSSGIVGVTVNGKDGNGKSGDELKITTTTFNLTMATDICDKGTKNYIRLRYTKY